MTNKLEQENIIVIFSGKSKSGKDHIADQIVSSILSNICDSTKIALADLLKQEYAFRNNVPLEELYDSDKKEKHRKDIINLAENEIKPILGKHYFAEQAFNIIKDKYKRNDERRITIITDCRYIEEMSYFGNNLPENHSIITVRFISNHDKEGCGFSLEGFPFDCIVYNDRTIMNTMNIKYKLLNSIFSKESRISKNFSTWLKYNSGKRE